MLTLQPCFYFRWLTRRHLHVSAKIATDSAKLVEPLLSDSSKQPTRTGDSDVPVPKKKGRAGRKPKITGPSLFVESNLHVPAKIATDSAKLVEPLSDSSKQPKRTGDSDVPVPKKRRGRERKVTGPSLLVESKVKDFLAHVESIKHTLGLEDLERYRPDRQPVPKLPEFEEQYIVLRDKLCRAFNKPQIQAFLKLYGMDFPAHSRKEAYVAMIIENAWSWPSLEKIKKEKIDWTVSSQRSSYLFSLLLEANHSISADFPMDPRRSFLLMGKGLSSSNSP